MKMRFWYFLWCWCQKTQDKARQQMVLKKFIEAAMCLSRFKWHLPKNIYGLQKRFQLFILPLEYPVVLREKVFWKSFITEPRFG
jgi:hypothetical protein